MRILVREGNDLIDSHVFESTPVTIGSDEGCSVRIRDRRLAPCQATLVPQGEGKWVLESEQSGERVLVNGRPTKGRVEVFHSDEIQVASYTIALYGLLDGLEASNSDSSVGGIVEGRSDESSEAGRLRAHPVPPGSVVRSSKQALTVSGDAGIRVSAWARRTVECPDIPRLIDLALDLTQERFGARLVFVGSRRHDYGALESEQSRLADGQTDRAPLFLEAFKFRCLERGEAILAPEAGSSGVGSVIAAPLSCHRGELGLLYADRKVGAARFTSEDLDELTLLGNLVAAQLARLLEQQTHAQESIAEGGLAFVRTIQERMDPTNVPQWAGYQLAAYCRPGQRRSGDVYDVMRLPNGLAGFLVGTVEGAPIATALAMAEARTTFRVSGLHADAPHLYLRCVNWLLCNDRQGCRMRGVALVLNPVTGEIEYGTAGECGAVIVDASGELRVLRDTTAPELGSAGGHGFEPRFDRLNAGETLSLYTLGCERVPNAEGVALGRENLLESLCDGFGQSANVALDELLRDHSAFFKDGTPSDDITILLFHRSRNGP
jgi:serine phosphatase RsbU (regulator of sigma subunit)